MYLGESDDQSQYNQCFWSVAPGHNRCYDRTDTAKQHSQTQRGFASVRVGQHATRHLRDYVPPKERAQH